MCTANKNDPAAALSVFSEFTPDADTYLGEIPKASYDSQYIEHFFQKHNRPDRVHFAVYMGIVSSGTCI